MWFKKIQKIIFYKKKTLKVYSTKEKYFRLYMVFFFIINLSLILQLITKEISFSEITTFERVFALFGIFIIILRKILIGQKKWIVFSYKSNI